MAVVGLHRTEDASAVPPGVGASRSVGAGPRGAPLTTPVTQSLDPVGVQARVLDANRPRVAGEELEQFTAFVSTLDAAWSAGSAEAKLEALNTVASRINATARS